jgi:hypothetical protein
MPLDALAPDQRAVVQLVLQRERSYAQIAELLKISEDAVRARAHAGLSALAPDVEIPADKLAQVSDFLLGQQDGKPRQATRRLLRSSNGAREWAETVRAQLEDVGGALPELPPRSRERESAATAGAEPVAAAVAPDPPAAEDPAQEPAAEQPASVAAAAAGPGRPAPRPRPLREKAAAGGGPDLPAPSTSGALAAGSSRIGGAVLIGVVLLALVGLLLYLFVFKSDDPSSSSDTSSSAAATATATPSATPQAVGQIALRGVNGSKGTGVMRLYTAQGQLAFTLAATGVPPNKSNEAYAVWFTTPGGGSQRLGFAQPVGSNGQLGTTGPRTEDLAKFPRWLARYKQVVVSRERTGNARTPGPIILRGTLPRGSG